MMTEASEVYLGGGGIVVHSQLKRAVTVTENTFPRLQCTCYSKGYLYRSDFWFALTEEQIRVMKGFLRDEHLVFGKAPSLFFQDPPSELGQLQGKPRRVVAYVRS